MDLLTVILACSLHADDQLVEAFIRKVSDANPLFVGDYVTLATHDDLASADQAVELAAAISEKGGRPALGLMAIPISWAARFNREPVDLLDACTNISIGTAMMASFASECGPRSRHISHKITSGRARRRRLEASRACVLEGFDRETGVQGFTQILSEIPRLGDRAYRGGQAAIPRWRLYTRLRSANLGPRRGPSCREQIAEPVCLRAPRGWRRHEDHGRR